MQVLVVAVQNAVGYEDLGVATSGNTLFRNVGSSIGTAIVGTIFATTLASNLAKDFPGAAAAQLSHSGHSLSAAALNSLPPQVHATPSRRPSALPRSSPSPRSWRRGSSKSCL
jgi:hypothetical protein